MADDHEHTVHHVPPRPRRPSLGREGVRSWQWESLITLSLVSLLQLDSGSTDGSRQDVVHNWQLSWSLYAMNHYYILDTSHVHFLTRSVMLKKMLLRPASCTQPQKPPIKGRGARGSYTTLMILPIKGSLDGCLIVCLDRIPLLSSNFGLDMRL